MFTSPRKPACIFRALEPFSKIFPEGASRDRASFGGDWTWEVVREPSRATPKGPAAYSWLAVTTSCCSDSDRSGLWEGELCAYTSNVLAVMLRVSWPRLNLLAPATILTACWDWIDRGEL